MTRLPPGVFGGCPPTQDPFPPPNDANHPQYSPPRIDPFVQNRIRPENISCKIAPYRRRFSLSPRKRPLSGFAWVGFRQDGSHMQISPRHPFFANASTQFRQIRQPQHITAEHPPPKIQKLQNCIFQLCASLGRVASHRDRLAWEGRVPSRPPRMGGSRPVATASHGSFTRYGCLNGSSDHRGNRQTFREWIRNGSILPPAADYTTLNPPPELFPRLYKCGNDGRLITRGGVTFAGGFIPAFARCCFCIAASLLVFTSPMTLLSLCCFNVTLPMRLLKTN